MLNYTWSFTENGILTLNMDGDKVFYGYSQAVTTDGRKIDTRKAEKIAEDASTATYRAENGLVLKQIASEGALPSLQIEISDASGAEVETNNLTVLNIWGGDAKFAPMLNCLFTRMLLVPYDNTMWLRYEAVPFRAGRKSYDYTLVFSEDTKAGMLIGATDFSVWKNAIVSSGAESRQFKMVCGVSDDGTHDTNPHGTKRGKTVASAPFVFMVGDDYRDMLEAYGDYLKEIHHPLEWKGGAPFGFNSWAGLAFRLNAQNFRATGKLFREQLRPAGYENAGEQYINFDAGWANIDPQIRKEIVEELHANGQHAGIYDSPFACFAEDIDAEIAELPGHTYREICLHNQAGELVERIDGAHPYDVTHPLWMEMEKVKTDYYKEMKFDYAKFDFISHAAAEGKHYNKDIDTGREAITFAYQYLDSLLSEEAVGHPFFISLSIAPLFPHGYAHARRFSCDAFGMDEDVEYVLNAQTWGWWENQRLYAFNDPDHICLLRGNFAPRDSYFGEARARYTTSVIGGTVMMLSDDYSLPEAVRRTLELTANREINSLAASRVAFRPVGSNGFSACNCFTASIGGKSYAAVFNWKTGKNLVSVPAEAIGAEAGSVWKDLWTGLEITEKNGFLTWAVDGCDALMLQHC